MDEPEWMSVLQVFWEENLSFEFSPNPKHWHGFIPDKSELEEIDVISHTQGLIKSGHLEVEKVDASHNNTAPFDSLTVIRISEKGLKAVREWEMMNVKAQWERQLLDAQEEYEQYRLERQQDFEKEQVTRTNEVDAAIGYLTIGLLIVTPSDVVLSMRQNLIPSWIIIGLVLIGVLGLIYKIQGSGLLQPE